MINRSFFWTSTILAVVWVMLPVVIGWGIRLPQSQFFGNSVLNVSDPAVYYNYIDQGRDGKLFMADQFTSEMHYATLFQPVWFVVGQLANVFHVSTIWAFLMTRWIGLVILLATTWWAIQWVFSDRFTQRLAQVLVAWAGGLGGLSILVHNWLNITQSSSPDLWIAEAFTYLSAATSGHFLLVSAGTVFVLVSVERAWQERTWRQILWAGLGALATLSVHPFHILTWTIFWIIMIAWYWAANKKFPAGYIARVMTVIGLAAPALLMHGLQLLSDPIVRGRAIQNLAASPSPLQLAGALGLLLPLGLIGAWQVRQGNARLRWMTGWAAAILIAMFLPISFQRRLSQGLVIPFALLSALPLTAAWRRSRTWSVAMVLVLCNMSIITSAIVVGGYVRDLRDGGPRYAYLSSEYQTLIRVVRKLPSNGAILSSVTDGNILGSLSRQTVYIGHHVETLNFKSKLSTLRTFYSSNAADQWIPWLREHQICYILYGPREQAYGITFQPQIWTELQLVWHGPTMRLYRVTSCI